LRTRYQEDKLGEKEIMRVNFPQINSPLLPHPI